MSTSVAVTKPPFSIRTLSLLIALVAMFVLGAAGGYVVKGVTTPAAPSLQGGTVCPAGQHAVVYYTAHTLECVSQAPR
jgi:hypothetical protein